MQETGTKSLESKLPRLLEALPDALVSADDYRGDLTVVVQPSRLRDVVRLCKTDPALSFEVLMDLFAMDYAKAKEPTPERFAVIYNLYSVSKKRRVRLKAFLPETAPEIASIHDLYKAANWFEREAWDLFGVRFQGHPHLIRILCHHEFVGHPLRKDYPADKYQRPHGSKPSSEL